MLRSIDFSESDDNMKVKNQVRDNNFSYIYLIR